MSATLTRLHHEPSVRAHRLVAVGVAGVVALVTSVAARLAGESDPVVRIGDQLQTIGVARIVLSAIAAGSAGWLALAAVERVLGRGRRAVVVWRRISVAVAAVSLVGPATADTSVSTRWWLVALHATVAVAFITAMSRGPTGVDQGR